MSPESKLRLLFLALAPCLLLGASPALTATADEEASPVARAQRLIEAGDLARAEQLLHEAAQAAHHDPTPLLALGTLLEGQNRKDEALAVYGTVLSEVDPQNAEARRRFRRMFYEGNFPRRLRVAHLSLSPVSFSVNQCILQDDLWSGSRPGPLLAHTTSLLFPKELARGGQAPWVRLPSLGGAPAKVMYNRLVYGLMGDDSNETLVTRWVMGYPSPTILPSTRDYAQLAGFLTSVLLRGHAYFQAYLGLRTGAEAEPHRAFLVEEGPTGAEQVGNRIFFMDAAHDRAPLEWIREAFHELGHLLLPQIGPFPGDERWANGELGERLLMQWLAEEAGALAQHRWPDPSAQTALDGLWSVGHIALNRYLATECRVPLGAWLATAPEDFDGEDGLLRFVGFALWVQAAHGRRALAQVLQTLPEPTPQGFIQAYRAMVVACLANGPLRIDAGALNPTASRLAAAPSEGALRRERILLAPEGHVAFRLWTPPGPRRLRVEIAADHPPTMTLSVDGGPPAVPGEDGWELAELAEGWHSIVVACRGSRPTGLVALWLF